MGAKSCGTNLCVIYVDETLAHTFLLVHELFDIVARLLAFHAPAKTKDRKGRPEDRK